MLRDNLILTLLRRAGNRLTDTDLAAGILEELIIIQEHVMERNPTKFWFQLSEGVEATALTGDADVSLPDDYLEDFDEGRLEYLTEESVWQGVGKDTYNVLLAKFAETAAGAPQNYALVGSSYILFPTPDADYTLRMRYVKKGESLAGVYGGSGNIENMWLKYAGDWMLAEAGERMARYYLQNPALADLFKQDVAGAMNRVHFENTAREEAARKRQMGDS